MEDIKIYIVFQQSYENIEVIGVFTNRIDATQIANTLSKYYTNECFEIDSFDLNRLTADGERRSMKIINNLIEELGIKDIVKKANESKE